MNDKRQDNGDVLNYGSKAINEWDACVERIRKGAGG